MARRTRGSGFTLIEIMVVVSIMALLVGGVTIGIRAVTKSELRSTSAKMASAIRYLFDRARTTGKYYRLVVDMDTGKYWAEQSDDRFMLVREKERSKRGRGPEEEEANARNSLEPKRAPAGGSLGPGSASTAGGGSGLGALLGSGGMTDPSQVIDKNGTLQPVQPKAIFKSFKETNLRSIQLKKGVKVADVYTPKQREPYTSGRAYLYFFPQGFGERAIIHLADSGESYYSLLVQPLTGRVLIQSGYAEIPRDYDRVDDEGKVSQP